MRKFFNILIVSLLVTVQAISAQEVVPSETLTKIRQETECTVYTFNYPTVNINGEQTVLSSALVAWTPSDRQETDSIESVHVLCHLTITSDHERSTTTDGSSNDQNFAVFMPGRRYGSEYTEGYANYAAHCIIIMPDYEGYGVTKNIPHPYLSQRLTAQQVLDGVMYGMELYKKVVAEKSAEYPLLPIKSDWRSFCMGYSQGGAVSLATQRLIEEKGLADELHFQGSLCGDGPYDLVTTMRYYLEDDGTSYGVDTDHRKGTSTYPVVEPLIMKSMLETHPAMAPYKREDFMSQQLLDTGVCDWIDSKEYTTTDINEMWYNQVKTGVDTQGRHYTPEQMAEMFSTESSGTVIGNLDKMFTQEVYDYMSDDSNFDVVPENPANAPQAMHRALYDNSLTTGWEPQHRIQFYHSKYDMIVPYGNYLAFRDAHPQGEDTMYRVDDTFSTSDHVMAGGAFLIYILVSKSCPDVFNWICEGSKPTGIREMSDVRGKRSDSWYDLQGRKLNGKPAQKGVYIYNGKTVVIK
jgi:hypothetical protein